jgi:hypothetical protein
MGICVTNGDMWHTRGCVTWGYVAHMWDMWHTWGYEKYIILFKDLNGRFFFGYTHIKEG